LGVDAGLPSPLLNRMDEKMKEKGYDNRSLAIADMVRAQLVEHRQKFGTEEIAGTITLVYDHHKQPLKLR
jgi:CopG family nickel-responsive transcriptional regulator